jgi:hypothetical protein
MAACPIDVRFTPESGHVTDASQSMRNLSLASSARRIGVPPSANGGHGGGSRTCAVHCDLGVGLLVEWIG